MSYFKLSWRRWLSWLAVVIVFAIACTFLSRWQFARRAEVVAKNDLISGNYCRCTGYQAIVDAIETTAKARG
mgnify:CR=1 FL=1